MYIKKIAIIIIAVLMLVSCSNSKEKDIAKIEEMEKTVLVKTIAPIDVEKGKELVDLYIKYADDYPEDTNSVNYLFKAANISMNIGKAQLSVELFDKIINDHPAYRKIADCMFLKAFVYDDRLKNVIKAREAYIAYLKKYPTHTWAKDVPGLIQMLGKTSEQIGAELLSKQKNDSLASK